MTQSVQAADAVAGDSTRLSRDHVISIWKKFEAAVSQWEESKVPILVDWDGGISRSFETLEPAVVELMESLQDDTVIDRSAWQIALAIDAFISAAVEWAEQVKLAPRSSNPSGSKALWDAFREVAPAMEDRLPERLESVASLLSLKNMTPQRVAVIYDWYDESGNPDVDRVEEERLAPGKHTSGFRNPARVKREKDIEDRWRNRCERFGGYDPSVFDGNESTEKPPAKTPPAPESFEELLSLEGMTLKQASDMKQVSIEQVREHARQITVMNADVAKMMGAELASERLSIDPEKVARRVQLQSATMETYAELETNERVWAMSDDGWGAGRIAAGLRAHGVGVSYEDVLRYLAQKPEVSIGRREEENETVQAEAPPQLKTGKTRGRPARKAT